MICEGFTNAAGGYVLGPLGDQLPAKSHGSITATQSAHLHPPIISKGPDSGYFGAPAQKNA